MKRFFVFIFLFNFLRLSAQHDTSVYNLSFSDLYNMQVVSASREKEPLDAAASTIYVITHEQIEARNYSSLAQLLYDIPRIIIQWKSSAENEHIFSINGILGNNKFLILLDGVRINSSMGAEQTIYESYSLENVKQVEVILGPASAVYGEDAFAGVVNIITYSPFENQEVVYNVSLGQFTTYKASVSASRKLTDNLGLLVSSKVYHSDEPFYPQFYPNDYQWYKVYQNTGLVVGWDDTLSAPVGIQPWDISVDSYNLRLKLQTKKLTVGYSSYSEGHSSSISGRPENSLYFNKAKYYHKLSVGFISYKYATKNEKLSGVATVSGQVFKVLPSSAFVNIFTGFNVAYKYEKSASLKFENILKYKISNNSTFSFAFSGETFDVIPKTGDLPLPYDESKSPLEQNIYYFGTNIVDYLGRDLTIYQDFYEIKYSSVGSYIQYKTVLHNHVYLTAGTRIDYDSRYGQAVSPRLGIVYSSGKKLKAKLLYGKAFLAPSPHIAYQHYGAFYPVYDTLGRVKGLHSSFYRLTNPNLLPEKLRTVELDLKYSLSSVFHLKTNFFYTNLKDYISWKYGYDTLFHGVQVDKYRIPVNEGYGQTYGYTIGGEYLVNSDNTSFILSAYYSYIDGEIDNKPLLFSSKHNLNASLCVNVSDVFGVFISLTYRDKSYYDYGEDAFAPGFVNTYLSVNYRVLQRHNYSMIGYFRVFNLLNVKYYNATDGTFGTVPQDPFRAEAGIKFKLF